MKFKIKHNGSPYNEYGKIIKLNWFQVVVALCLASPGTNWIIPFCKKLMNYEVCRITLHNKEV